MRIQQLEHFIFAAMMLAAGISFAQTSQEIVGTVKDATGAVVSDARITARHLATNETRETRSDAGGDFRLLRLTRVGEYEVRVEKSGFRVAVAPKVLVETGQTVRLDLPLQIGEVAQSVQVEETASLVRSETASLETVIQNREILELPLNGRNFLQLTALSPGVSTNGPQASGYNSFNLSVSGGRARDNDYRIDGLRAMASYSNNIATLPPLDSLQEFELIRNLYSAEYGRAIGAVVEVRTKSGTNQLHGSAYEFARRGDWAAIPYFARTRPNYRIDQFGGSIGGPVYLPKLYKGRDRTFFFFAYEQLYQPSQVVAQFYTMTDAERSGDFTQSPFRLPRDPLTNQPFASGRIPASRFSPVAVNLLNIFPQPNQTLAGDVNWTGNFPANSKTHTYVARLDHQFNTKHSVFGSATLSKQKQISASRLDCGSCEKRISDEDFLTDGQAITLGYTWLMTPAVVLQVRGGRSINYASQEIRDKTRNYARELGFDFFPTDERKDLWGPPRVNVGRFAWFGTTNSPYVSDQDIYNGVAVLSINKGAHYVKAGTDLAWDRFASIGGYGSRGAYFGNDLFTGNQNADFILGHYGSANFQFEPDWYEARRPQLAFYVQDDWKIKPKLTLNVGLRYDYTGPYDAWKTHRLHRFDLAKNQVVYPKALEPLISADVRARLLFPYRFEGPSTSYDAQKNDFAPRIGLAYRPTGQSTFVIRAGYGIFYNSPMGLETIRSGRIAPWDAYLAFRPTPDAPLFFHRADGSLKQRVFASPGFTAPVEPGFKTSYNQQWNLSVQKQLTGAMALELAYAGSRAVNMSFQRDADAYAPLYGLSRYFTTVNMTTNGLDSRYDSLQVSLQQRFSQGLSFRANYTWSKLMNDYADYFDNGTVSVIFRKNLEWGRGFADHRHNLNLSGIYELPFGRGRRLAANVPRVVDYAIGGWKLNYILQLNSGFPVNLVYNAAFRPDAVPGRDANLPVSERTVDRWFDPTAFARPAAAARCEVEVPARRDGWFLLPCQGNLGRNVVDGPGFANLDTGVSKFFPIRENHRAEFRAEFFNVTNHPALYWNLGNGSGLRFDLAGASRLTAVRSNRTIQLAVRYSF